MARRGENIYKRKDGRWEARVIRGYNEHSKAIYAYFYGRTYKEVKEKIFAPLPYVGSNAESIPQRDDETLLFGSLLDRWLDNSKIKFKESSYVKYFNLINNHIKPSLGKHPLPSVNNVELSKFVADKLKGKCDHSNRKLSEKTVKDIISVIKSALRYARDESLMSANVNINIVLPKERAKDMRVLSTDEQTDLEKYLCADMNENKLGILVCLYTGLRVGEICALKWSDISFENGTLTVRRTMQRIQSLEAGAPSKTKVIVTDPKSNSSVRTIPLPDCLINKLKMFCHDRSDTYLLTGELGRYVEPRTYQNRFKSYLINSGIKGANFHSVRHTFATRCVALGFEIKSLSEILGHANVNITLNRYVHPSFDLKRSNMNKLEVLH